MFEMKNAKCLISLTNWLVAPNGEQYKAVFGTVDFYENGWFTMGDMRISDDYVLSVIKTSDVNDGDVLCGAELSCAIYFSDGVGRKDQR